jgi:hypothetical protein
MEWPIAFFENTGDIVKYLASTPGAVGYIEESEVKPGMNVIVRT